ncbi:oligosaccharyl transferase, archaeosortase A system-associated [Methanospirillum stamsii]|uniref:dolichyl-phosphooligosaccharide-protein glycotransferase n=1 Tax=Methanospirillum stamsii TaxID=1277351 RepID=A0A2V2NKM8_9EURY|nr:oligosaccharyl transferase, archaeosortase A system-associated [Methanospirillum stamsii]PWR76161.1 hypothetical protein DLD82_01320 [Methanospirillum stamsii]
MTTLKTWLNTYSSHLLILLVIISALFGLWLRFLPMEYLGDGPVQKLIFMDTWYSMRQIEQITANYPGYAWFDPMTAFPVGKDVDWGPLFPFLCASACVLFGALARPENMIIASYIPPLLFLLLIPIIWYLGKLTGDEKTGWIAAILLPVISGELLYRSFYGYLDHHITETLFSTLFITLIITLLITIGNIKTARYSKKSILLAVSAGVAYFLGIMNVQTMVLFAAICALIFLIHALLTRDRDNLISLFLHTCLFFITFTILYLLLGLSHDGISLSNYSIGHVLVALALPLELGFLTLTAHICEKKSPYYYIGIVSGAIIAGYVFIAAFIPELASQITGYMNYFFFFSYTESFINEMQMWEPVRAWYSYNIALFLAFLGIIICIIRLIRSYQPALMGLLVWGMVLIFATVMHLRYEYYVSVVIVLFSAVTLSTLYSKIVASEEPETRSKKSSEPPRQVIPFRAIAVVGIIMLLITAFSAQTVMTVADKQIGLISISNDWADSLVWLSENSPDPGVNYYNIYQKTEFSYPEESYGVLSWWDYGHWISFLTKRIPVTSPFQDNVPAVGKFLAAQSEDDAEHYAKETGTRYIITDYATVTSKFAALPLWAYGKDSISEYQETYYQQSPGTGRYDAILVLKQPFFNSTASKLHLFDGSWFAGRGGTLLSVSHNSQNGGSFSQIIRAQEISAEEAKTVPTSSDKVTGSIQFTKPITDVAGLGHYRLIYESPSTVAEDDTHQIKEVKIFERVNGYTLPGTGTIELPMTTNQGRNFTWKQQSSNGTFTLPYSTKNNPYDVRATGPYRILETGETVEVLEEQVK